MLEFKDATATIPLKDYERLKERYDQFNKVYDLVYELETRHTSDYTEYAVIPDGTDFQAFILLAKIKAIVER